MFRNERGQIGANTAIIALIAAIVVAVIVFLGFTVIIPRGHVGVVDIFGVVDDNEFGPGFNLRNPMAHFEIINTQTQEHEYREIKETLTKEGLEVEKIDVSVIYRIKPESASDLYKTVKGDPFDTLITPTFMGILRDEIKRWTAEDIYTGKSSEIQADVEKRLKGVVEPRGIIIEYVWLRGLKLPPKIIAAIEAKMTEKQEVEQMIFTVEKQKLEAQRMLIEANATAQANRIKAASMTPEIIQWEFVQAIKNNPNVVYVPIGGASGGSIILPSPEKK